MRRNDAGYLRPVLLPEGQEFAWLGDGDAHRVYRVAASYPMLTQSRGRIAKFASVEEAREHAAAWPLRQVAKWQAIADAVNNEEPADWSDFAKASEPQGVAS